MRKNEDLLVGFGNIDSSYVEEARIKKPERNFSVKLASMVACLAVFVASLTVFMFIPYGDHLAKYSGSEYYELIQSIDSLSGRKEYKNRFEALSTNVADAIIDLLSLGFKKAGAAAPEDAGDNSVSDDISGEYVETTDNQTDGVIEADLFKRTSTHIFYLNGLSLYAYSIEGEESGMVGSYDIRVSEDTLYSLYGSAEMYLSLDGRTVTVIQPYVNSEKKHAVRITSLDVSNPESISERRTISFSGNYLSSRLDDGRITMFTSLSFGAVEFTEPETFVPTFDTGEGEECISPDKIIIPEQPTRKSYTVISVLDESTCEIVDNLALFSYADTVYVSESSIYTVSSGYNNGTGVVYTDITRLDYSSDGLKEGMTYTVPGTILNQYSLDEYDGVLRVVTTESGSASLFCFDKESGEIVGRVLRFAPNGEEVTSVRFDGEYAYVCTAVVVTFTDPVFFFDLSDYSDISYTDTGYIDGFSSSLINYGDGILLGMGELKAGTVKVETYAEVEGEVISIDVYELYGEASEDYKSYYVNRKEGLFGFGYESYDPRDLELRYRYVLLSISDGVLKELVHTPIFSEPSLMRAVYIDGYLYILGEGDFKVVSLDQKA